MNHVWRGPAGTPSSDRYQTPKLLRSFCLRFRTTNSLIHIHFYHPPREALINLISSLSSLSIYHAPFTSPSLPPRSRIFPPLHYHRPPPRLPRPLQRNSLPSPSAKRRTRDFRAVAARIYGCVQYATVPSLQHHFRKYHTRCIYLFCNIGRPFTPTNQPIS